MYVLLKKHFNGLIFYNFNRSRENATCTKVKKLIKAYVNNQWKKTGENVQVTLDIDSLLNVLKLPNALIAKQVINFVVFPNFRIEKKIYLTDKKFADIIFQSENFDNRLNLFGVAPEIVKPMKSIPTVI